MLSKIALLLFVAHAISAFNMVPGPYVILQAVMQQLNSFITAGVHEASISIRDNTVPLYMYTDNARDNVYRGLTEDAQPFWTKIALLTEQAKKVGKSSCIDEGMELFYELNITVTAEPNTIINNYLTEGNKTMFKSYDEIDAVRDGFDDLTTSANECTQDECATDLLAEAISFYSTALEGIRAAVDEINKYVQVDLEKNLATVQVDTASYVSKYNIILGDVETCID